MAWFNEGVVHECGFVLDFTTFCPDAYAVCLGRGGAYECYERALAELEDYGEESGGASARYAAQKSEMREVVEQRIKMHLESNEVAWQSNAQRARDAADAAAASDATGEEHWRVLAAMWADVEECWTIAIAAKNGAKEDGMPWDWDFSGPEGEECEKGIAEAVAKQKAARESAK
jgi:hypothetical protein